MKKITKRDISLVFLGAILGAMLTNPLAIYLYIKSTEQQQELIDMYVKDHPDENNVAISIEMRSGIGKSGNTAHHWARI